MRKLLILILICFSCDLSFSQTFTPLHAGVGGFLWKVYNNKLYFNGWDAAHGSELWVTDGSQGSAYLVKDIWPGSISSNPVNFTVFNSLLFFTAISLDYGWELWESDGTDSGTNVLDLYTGEGSSLANDLLEFNGVLFMGASTPTWGNEPWYTEGTFSGTYILADINNLSDASLSSLPHDFTIFNDELFFSADDGIYAHGREPWVTDGTTNGTHLLKDVYTGWWGSNAGGFIPLNDKLYFIAEDSLHGYELWVTDGTEANTALVKDIRWGTESSSPSCLIVLNNELYFRAQGTTKGIELYKSDGTDTGTVLVKDIRLGGGSSLKLTTEFHLFNNKILFAANDGTHGIEPWITDGTDSGTVLLKDLNPGLGDSSPRVFTDYNGKVFFIANDHLWETNGTDSGTFEIEPPGVTYPYPLANSPRMIVFNGELYFNAIFDSSTLDIWKYNDAIATTTNNVVEHNFNFSIYPNPFRHTLNIQSTNNPNGCLTLENLIGQRVFSGELNSCNTQLDLSLIPSGFYILRIASGKQSFSQKVIKL